MKRVLLGILIILSIRLEAQSIPPAPQTTRSAQPARSANVVTYKVLALADGSFSYDIFSGDHRIIHQTTIPGRPGNKGFRRKEDAQKVARLVVEKMNKHILPPTVTTHEMDSLKIEY